MANYNKLFFNIPIHQIPSEWLQRTADHLNVYDFCSLALSHDRCLQALKPDIPRRLNFSIDQSDFEIRRSLQIVLNLKPLRLFPEESPRN